MTATMTTKFVVDELSHDNRLGRTKSIVKIIHNIKRFSTGFYDNVIDSLRDKNEIFLFTHVGRFIVYLRLNRDLTQGDLMFFDAENDIDKSLDTVNRLFDNDSYKLNQFMITFNKLAPFYEEDFSLAEISLGDSIFN